MRFAEAHLGPPMSCGELRQAALASHATCYRDSGFCALDPADRLLFLGAVDPEDLDLSTALSTELGCL
jgi:hypothetical protein